MKLIDILERIKDEAGNTIEYVVIEHNNHKAKPMRVSADKLRKSSKYVSNARLTPNGEFRGHGDRIKTTVDLEKLKKAPAIRDMNNVKTNQNRSTIDYYGKEHINACRNIRRLAYAGRIEVDKAITPHSSNAGNNIHLIKLIEACGISVKDFLTGYLTVIQPYYLEPFQKDRNKDKSNIWVCDIGYRTKLVIKLDIRSQYEGILVSFHESNRVRLRRMSYSQSIGAKEFYDKPCAVLVDRLLGQSECNGNRQYYIEIYVQRGFMRNKINMYTPYYNNGVALVNYKQIADTCQSNLDKVLNNIWESYLDTTHRSDLRLSIERVSFISYGYTLVNNICLLIDCFSDYTDISSRAVIIEAANNMLNEAPIDSLVNLKEALESKLGTYGNFENELYLGIMKVCKDSIGVLI